MSDTLPVRKTVRYFRHDYNGGVYFVTVCTKDHRPYFGYVHGDTMYCTQLGLYLEDVLTTISSHCPYADIPVWIVMPNHFHAIIVIDGKDSTNRTLAGFGGFQSRLATVIGRIKGDVTRFAKSRNINFAWQFKYYDHIVRRNMDTKKIVEYITTNPARWSIDRYNPDSGR